MPIPKKCEKSKIYPPQTFTESIDDTMPQWYNFLITENEVRKRIPIEQRITPEDIAQIVLFLSARKNDHGQIIMASGAKTLW